MYWRVLRTAVIYINFIDKFSKRTPQAGMVQFEVPLEYDVDLLN